MAQWIWYPGDFEYYLGLNMYDCRSERGSIITPIWEVENFHPNVTFYRTFTLQEDTYITIHTTGTRAMYIDGGWYLPYDENLGLKVPKGTHELTIICYSRDTLPAIYIDHPVLATGEGWQAAIDKITLKPAGYWNFTDVAFPPSSFSFEKERRDPVVIKKLNGGILYDFGQELMARVCAEKVSGTGELLICLGESEEEAIDKDNCTIFEKKLIKESAENVSLMQYVQGMRYAWIEDSEAVAVSDVYAEYEHLPMLNRSAFQCNNDVLNRMYEIALHTLSLCTREFCLDGIKRDRWAWGGDAAQSYLLQYYSFFDTDVCKRTIRFLRGKENKVLHINTIQSYTLFWFISLGDYYWHTGDEHFLKEIYESARLLMDDLCLPLTDERGFLMSRDFDWLFIDWTDGVEINVGDVAFTQLLFARDLEVMSLLAEIAGDDKSQKRYTQLHKNLLQKVFDVFWDDKRGCFTNGPKDDENAFVTKYANMFAMMFGYLNESQKKSIKKAAFLNSEVPEIVTPYMKFYELLALGELEMHVELHDYLLSYWGGMMEQGCTSFWEEYNPKHCGLEHYRQGTRKFGKSLCHAWGAGPLLLFGKYYLGVRPTQPGYRTFEIRPHLMGLSTVKGTVPFPQGSVSIELNEKNCSVSNDSDGQGTLFLDGKESVCMPHTKITVSREE